MTRTSAWSAVAPGTTAERLLHGGSCPVLVAPAGLAADWAPERIGVGYVAVEEAEHALAAADALARLGGAPLEAVTVVAPRMVGAAVPALAPVMSQLNAALGGLDLLTAPTTITVGRVTSASAFRPVAATIGTTPTGQLPRTGTNAAVPAMAAVLVAASSCASTRHGRSHGSGSVTRRHAPDGQWLAVR